jgi:glutamate racemase
MIGVFDSGIGGLTLLHELKKTLPQENFIYYADTDNVPYSYKTPEEIKGFVEKAVVFLHEKGCQIIVLACNTATNVAIVYLREKYDFPIVAIQPAVKVAADNNVSNKKIIVCATPVTLASSRYQNLIKTLNINDLITNIALPKLVEFAEQGNFDGEEVLDYLKKSFENLDLNEYQFIVLGCTHFTFFENLIQANFPTLKPIDGNAGTARRVASILQKENLFQPFISPEIKCYESGRFIENPVRFLKLLSYLK